MTLVRNSSLEWVMNKLEEQETEIQSLTDDLVAATQKAERAEALEAELSRIKAAYPDLVY